MEMTKQSSMMKRLATAALSALTIFTLSACGQNTTQSDAKPGTVSEMTGENLDKILEDTKQKENYLVIDVRPSDEYKEGTVKYAVNIPEADIDSKADTLNDYKDKDIVTIADSKDKSEVVAKKLVDKGFNKVSNAEGIKDHQYTVTTKVQFVIGDALQKAADSGDYTILDARDEKDYEAGHLMGAKRIDVKNLDEEIKQVPKDKPVMTYCYSGNKSYKAAQKLVDEGWSNVYNSNDGTKEHDFELVKD
ncbi:MAG: rhodanese-like domain-containing protein [Aerococcus sp.]|nr:rhodanese-like domain-containing protein [Aerococcus sp.]